LVLLAVPKTGTQAYEAALGPRASMVITDPPELKHAPLFRYNRFLRPMFDKMGAPDMELAAVIREPFDWLGSWYRYRQRGALDGRPASTKDVDFNTFLEASCEDTPPAYANVGSQARFVAPRANGTRVAHLFRYEDQSGLQGFLEARIGPLPEIAHRNRSVDLDLTMSDATRALVEQRRAADFDLWKSIPIR
jgi:hypothetical protein